MLGNKADREAGAQSEYNKYLIEEGSRGGARKALEGYGYKGYESPYKSYFERFANEYLNGDGLTRGQEGQLARANEISNADMNAIMANRGGTIGGQLAMKQKLDEGLGRQRLQMKDENVGRGLSILELLDRLGRQENYNQNTAEMRYKELMSQNAANEAKVEEPKRSGGFLSSILNSIF